MSSILSSYPRSGNHLVRFFIESLTGEPTSGCRGNPKDIEIYKNYNENNTPFKGILSIKTNKTVYTKCHFKNQIISEICRSKGLDNLILIVRNPKECLIRHGDFNISESYFDLIDIYVAYRGKKLLLYYEDIIQDKVGFTKQLADFLDCNDTQRSKYVIENVEELFKVSYENPNVLRLDPASRAPSKSNLKLSCYYDSADQTTKNAVDNILSSKRNIDRYKFLYEYYKL